MGEPEPADVIDIDAHRLMNILQSAVEQQRQQRIPDPVLLRLKHLQAVQQSLIEGCAAGLGIDPLKQRADFNIDTGLITITPLV